MRRLWLLVSSAAHAAALTARGGVAQIPIPVPVAFPVPVPVPGLGKIVRNMLPPNRPDGHEKKGRVARYFWSGKNGDSLRTGASQHVGPMRVEDGPAWSWHPKALLPENSLIRAAPLIDGAMNIYLATTDGHIHKFNKDAEHLWKYFDPVGYPDIPVIYEGALYVSNYLGIVTALDMETGRPRWVRRPGNYLGSPDTWSMGAGEGIIVAPLSTTGLNSDRLVALDAKSGDTRWTFAPDSMAYNSLQSIKDGSLYFSDSAGKLYCVNTTTGALRWKAGPGRNGERLISEMTTGGGAFGPNNVIYVTSVAKTKTEPTRPQGFVTAFSLTGEVLWRKTTDYPANNAAAVGPAGAKGKLAVVVGVGENPDIPIGQAFGVKENLPLLRKKEGRVLAFDAATGEEIWRFQMPDWHGWAAGDKLLPLHMCLPDSFSNPSIGGDGTVYIGNQNGRFYAIRDRDGDGQIDADAGEVSSYDTGNSFQGSPAIAPGMVVATPCNGMYVFKTATS